MAQIKTFEAACKVLGHDPERVLPKVGHYPKTHQKALLATAKLIIINQALNFQDNGKKDWKPDWTNYNEGKYYPWFDLEKGGNNPTGFRLYGVRCEYSDSYVGARLLYRTRALAEYAAKQFESLYRDLMVVE
jgi:hypothetical protein